jgi:hypothetical protein
VTPDEFLAMAKEAGMHANVGYIIDGEHKPAITALKTSVPVEWLAHFAALVAAKAAADEREACAQVCDANKDNWSDGYAVEKCSAAIRARGAPQG